MPVSSFIYGPGSFRRHGAEARRLGLGLRVVREPLLGYDVDWPADLADRPRRRRVEPDLRRPARALAVGAHPDDVEFGCGGTLAKWAAGGHDDHAPGLHRRVEGLVGPRRARRRLVATRQDEQRAAARALGGSGDVVFLGYPDGELAGGLDERRELRVLDPALQPDVVLGHDPWRRYRLHPDHRHAGFLADRRHRRGTRPALLPRASDVAPHRPTALLLWEADEPNHTEDITEFLEHKLAALLAHRSQFRSTHRIDDPADEAQVQRFRAHVARRAAEHGADAHVDLGERFRIITDL